jgi:Fe2+ or Zn2+ uptake regulation protein
MSASDALAYLLRHGEKMSASNLRHLSDKGIIKSSSTSGGHRRYTAEWLTDYLSGFEHRVFYIASCGHINTLVINTSQLTIMKSERHIAINLKAASLEAIVVEIYNRVSTEKGSCSIVIGASKEFISSGSFGFLANLLSDTKTTLILS